MCSLAAQLCCLGLAQCHATQPPPAGLLYQQPVCHAPASPRPAASMYPPFRSLRPALPFPPERGSGTFSFLMCASTITSCCVITGVTSRRARIRPCACLETSLSVLTRENHAESLRQRAAMQRHEAPRATAAHRVVAIARLPSTRAPLGGGAGRPVLVHASASASAQRVPPQPPGTCDAAGDATRLPLQP